MDANERGRKRRETAAPETDSVPPPRRRKVLNELDPEVLWDKETDEDSEEFEAEDEGLDGEEESNEFDNSNEDLDDWDHPIRRLKIN